jgi:hypothetical protein
VHVSRWTSRCVAVSAIAAVIGQASAAPTSRSPSFHADSSAAYEDGLLTSGEGAMVLLPNHSQHSDNSDLLRFRTDVCGVLQSVENRRSMIRQSSYDDDMDLYENDNPSDVAAEVIEQWLSAHAEIAVITDGVQKSCDDSPFDDDQPTDTIASWAPGQHQLAEPRVSPPQRLTASYIA